MNKIQQSFLLILTMMGVGSLVCSCSTDHIDAWQSKSLVWFTDTLQDFTNKQQPDVPEGGTLRVAIPLTFAGDIASYDREVNVEVVKQPSDSRTSFTIETPVRIRAGHAQDTMYVNLINSSHLDAVYDSITFRLQPSDDFEMGLPANQTTTLALHNGYKRPDWWDEDCEYVFGYFTQLKMEIFIKCTGGTDDIRTTKDYWTSSDIAVSYWLYVLNDYIEQNGIVYPDDDINAPGEMPYFDWGSY